jgi:hypothetical protein
LSRKERKEVWHRKRGLAKSVEMRAEALRFEEGFKEKK